MTHGKTTGVGYSGLVLPTDSLGRMLDAQEAVLRFPGQGGQCTPQGAHADLKWPGSDMDQPSSILSPI